jgi:hypothetical protein
MKKGKKKKRIAPGMTEEEVTRFYCERGCNGARGAVRAAISFISRQLLCECQYRLYPCTSSALPAGVFSIQFYSNGVPTITNQ